MAKGDWHAEARELREQGWTYAKIAAKFNVTTAAVYFVINPDKRTEYALNKNARDIATRASQSAA